LEEILTARETAQFLKMNERTVLKLASEGKIPAAKIGRRWRFERNLIIEWLESRMRSMPNHELAGLENRVEKPRDPLLGVLHPEAVNLELASRSRRGVIRELVDMLVATGVVTDKKALCEAVLERESLATTGVGEGVAFPHPRKPSGQYVQQSAVAFGRSSPGVDFGAVDGEPTNLFFLVCTPDEGAHLKILARLNRIMRSSALKRELMEAGTSEEAIRCVRREEERLGLIPH